MCGRFTLRTPAAVLKDFFGLDELPGIAPRYNIAPTQPVGVVRSLDGVLRWDELRWGLVPGWARDPSIGNRMINARAETLGDKPAFREAFEQRRCAIPADGFYEWQKLGGAGKQPYFLHRRDDQPFAFAGLWERWRDRHSRQVLESCALVTTEPNDLVAPIHDRMPVMLHREAVAEWLRPDVEGEALRPLLQPFPATAMEAVPVSTAVNRPENDTPACITPVTQASEPPRLF